MDYKKIARERNKIHDGRRKATEKQIIDEADLIGVIAEGEFAQKYGLPFNDSILVEGDGKVDFVLADGRTIDIKATTRPYGKLLYPVRKDILVDVFVLAIVNLEKETARFAGWATKEELIAAPIVNYGYRYGAAYALTQPKLRPMGELL